MLSGPRRRSRAAGRIAVAVALPLTRPDRAAARPLGQGAARLASSGAMSPSSTASAPWPSSTATTSCSSPGVQAAGSLLPGAELPGRALRDRRRDRDRRGRTRRPAGLRRPAAAHPSGGVADRDAGRADPRPLHRLRRAGHRGRERCSSCPTRAPRAPGAADRRNGIGPDPGDHRTRPRPSRGSRTARAWWPRTAALPTGPASAPGWSRSSACGRSTPSSSATAPARRRARSAR